MTGIQVGMAGSLMFPAAAAGPTFNDVSTAYSASNTGSLAVNKPAGYVTGDLLLAFVITDSASGASPIGAPGGWTTIATQTGNVHGVYGLVGGSSEPASYTFTHSDSGGADIGIILLAVTGANLTDYNASTWSNSTTTNTANATSAGGIAICLFTQELSVSSSGTPSGFSIASADYSNRQRWAVFYQEGIGSGTISAASTSWGGQADNIMLAFW